MISPTVGGTLTTKTDSDSGQHYEYQLNTAQGLWKNEWREDTGSGSGQGSGWAYLTTDTSGTSTITISPPSDPLELYRWGRTTSVDKQITQTIKGDSSDKLNYSYDDEFTLTKTGWSTSETGSGTWKKSDHYESRANGSVSESGSGVFGPLDWYTWGTNLRFQASTSLDVETVRDSKSTATFNWSNDEWTVTEKTTTSSKRHDYRVSEFGAQLWHSSGNVGAGNGGVGTANMSWSSTRRDDVTESSETTKSITSGKGGVVWNAKHTSRENDVTTLSLDEVRHSESHGRSNTVTDGVYNTAKSDSTEDLEIHSKTKQREETNEHWESSFDGKAYGTTIDTFDETITSESTTFNKWDDEYLYTSKSWNASGIISQHAEGAAYHTLTEGSTSSTETEIDTNAGYQPTFMGSTLLGKGIFTAVSMSGAGAAGTSKFEFSVPTMTFTAGGAITLGQLPQVRLGTTDFDQIGQAVDTRTYWQRLGDLVSGMKAGALDAGAAIANAALSAAVWVVEQVGQIRGKTSDAIRWMGDKINQGAEWLADKAGDITGSTWLSAVISYMGGASKATFDFAAAINDLPGTLMNVWNNAVAHSNNAGGGIYGAWIGLSAALGITQLAEGLVGVDTLSGENIRGFERAQRVLSGGGATILAGTGMAGIASKAGLLPSLNRAAAAAAEEASAAARNAAKAPRGTGALSGGCFVPGTSVRLCAKLAMTPVTSGAEVTTNTVDATLSTTPTTIENVELGSRVPEQNPRPEDYDLSLRDVDQETWRQVDLRLRRKDGAVVEMQLLRPVEWIENLELSVGSEFKLTLSEFEVNGNASVTAIGPSCEIADGEGSVVTGRFATRQVSNLVEVTLENGTTFTGTTTHPVWIPEKHDWVELGDLKKGQRLATLSGPMAVTKVSRPMRVSDVFNIEVHGHHVYRITEDGILVHNNSSISTKWGWTGSNSWRSAVKKVSEGGIIRKIDGKVASYQEAVRLIDEAGGTIQRVDPSHAGSLVAGHIDFPHINFSTASGIKGHLEILALP